MVLYYCQTFPVEQVEPGSAVLDEGGLAVAGVCRTIRPVLRTRPRPIISRCGGTGYKTMGQYTRLYGIGLEIVG
jgi:hypothetical protein